MNNLNGTNIANLIGLSESDDSVLDLIETLGVDVSELERDEDDGSYDIVFDDTLGVDFTFDAMAFSPKQKSENIGGLYLNAIYFYNNCTFLPYNITFDDSLEVIEKKIGRPANYIVLQDDGTTEDDLLYWSYEDIGLFRVIFTDNKKEKISSIDIIPYEDPHDPDVTFYDDMKPFER